MGHTDDVADDAHNQKLSEDRAAAVKDRLAQLADLAPWQVTATGKGESEPAVKDATNQARAANRRVVITITPTSGTRNSAAPTAAPSSAPPAAPSSSGAPDGTALPEPKGPVGAGPGGVTAVCTSSGSFVSDEQVTIPPPPQVVRAGGLLFSWLSVTVGPGSRRELGSVGLVRRQRVPPGQCARRGRQPAVHHARLPTHRYSRRERLRAGLPAGPRTSRPLSLRSVHFRTEIGPQCWPGRAFSHVVLRWLVVRMSVRMTLKAQDATCVEGIPVITRFSARASGLGGGNVILTDNGHLCGPVRSVGCAAGSSCWSAGGEGRSVRAARRTARAGRARRWCARVASGWRGGRTTARLRSVDGVSPTARPLPRRPPAPARNHSSG